MPRIALTDRFVAGIRQLERSNFFDLKTRGLALRVSPSGAKTWAFIYRVNRSPSEWIRLGTYPAITLVDARKHANKLRALVDEGRNPAAERRAEQARIVPPEPSAFTFNDLADLYATVAAGQKKTWRADVAKITTYLRPAWGARELRSLTRAHVHELLDGLVAKGLTVGVNRVQALVSKMFSLAVDRSLLDSHPAARMAKRFKEQPSDRVLTDDELRALWAGLNAQPGSAADALRLRLLLGQRGAEIAEMTWIEVDLEARVWQMPGTRTKNGRPHAVPLPATAYAVLTRARATLPADEPRVFPFATLRSDDHQALAVIHGGAYEWKDLRRTVATRIAGLGFDETIIGRVLNHAKVSVTAKHYNQHAYLDEKQRALAAWDRELAAIVANEKRAARTVLRHHPKGRAR